MSRHRRSPSRSFIVALPALVVALSGCLPGEHDVSPLRPTPPVRAPGVGLPPPPPGNVPTFGGCQVFPADNPFNTAIDNFAVRPESNAVITKTNTLGANHLQFDVYSDPYYGMFPIAVPASQPLVPIIYDQYPKESDPGPWPIPLTAKQENGSDKHILVVQQGSCQLYELWASHPAPNGWYAGSGAKWDLTSNATRTPGWTSADAAGLPIFPGLLRYDEVASGAINHVLRFTAARSRAAYIAPASHVAGAVDASLLPMGARLRLKASFDTSSFTGQSKVIAAALKKFGLILADNGQNWMISGESDSRWDDNNMNQIRAIPSTELEYVDNGPITAG